MIDLKMRREIIKTVGMDGLQDVYKNGAQEGFNGFTYHADTVKFFKKHKKAIIQMVFDLADNIGEEPAELVGSFRCLNYYDPKTHKWESYKSRVAVWETITGLKPDDQVANALAWFALEETAREVMDR